MCVCVCGRCIQMQNNFHMVFVCADTGFAGHVCTKSGSRKMDHLIGSLDNESEIIPPQSALWLQLTYL